MGCNTCNAFSEKPSSNIAAFSREKAPVFDATKSKKQTKDRVVNNKGIDWSPDGKRLAFTWRDSKSSWGISITDLSHASIVAKGLSSEPYVSLGVGNQLFWWDKLGNLSFLEDATTRKVSATKTLPSVNSGGQVSPIGNPLAMVTFSDSNQSLIFLETPTLASGIAPVFDFPIRMIRWSPKGDQLVVFRYPNQEEIVNSKLVEYLYVYDLILKSTSPLVTNRQVLQHSWGWTKDGRYIFFAERTLERAKALRVWKVDSITKKQELIVDFASAGINIDAMIPSPDGNALLVVQRKSKDTYELGLINLIKKKWWTVAKGDLWMPSWSPNGDKFAVSINRNLWIIQCDTLKGQCFYP
jgi:Tol biopolymer transport system component